MLQFENKDKHTFSLFGMPQIENKGKHTFSLFGMLRIENNTGKHIFFYMLYASNIIISPITIVHCIHSYYIIINGMDVLGAGISASQHQAGTH